jgi:hypothetical protein
MQQLNRSLREIDEQEMLFITALSPRTIRRGKTGSALVVCLAIGLPLQLAVLNLTSAFASLGKLGVCLLLLGMPAACVVLVTVGVAIAWSPLPAFHKRYLAPAILLLLSSPLILNSLGALSLHWLPDKFSQEWSLMTTLVWGIEARLWGILAWLMGWLVVWLIASQAADRWLLRRAAWKRN